MGNVCAACGESNPVSVEFCGSCGVYLRWHGERQPAPAPAPPQGERRPEPPRRSESAPGEWPCPACSTPNPPDRRFCRRCGQVLGAAQTQVLPRVADPGPPPRKSWWRRMLGSS